MKKILPAIILVFIFLFLTACNKEKKYYEGSGKVIANINGYKLTEDKLDLLYKTLPENIKQQYRGEEGKKKLIEQLTVQKLLVQEAKRLNLDKNPEFLVKREMDEDSLIMEQYYKYLFDNYKPDEKALKDFYNSHPEIFAPQEEFEAYHILITPQKDQKVFNTKKSDAKNEKEAQKKIKMIQRLLKKGVPFEKVAKEYSEGPSAPRGGYLGKFNLGRMIPEFENALKKMKPGEISEPVKTRFGYHIIYLKNRTKPAPKPFEQLSEKEKNQVMQQFFRNLLENKIKELKAQAQIVVQK
ncbi:peptidyl-prolyl cis-trans isomerase C [Thermotomaculum hydrothermale]|uniref:peptidylprolyl isomerase n=1 Tax=Thermotomaculum hydrothermale TaxID=981385 RepID=A0A7R6PY24_9BACT|nr:peptidylprolyl isomerase [Thermotomaculum hydrothermale]BBB31693.1 peptidyl-prolyl cis-trans isomerase C [Thermotomaculum hydrothermale]